MPDDRLNKIVQRMIDAGETEVNIAGVIKHWKKNNPPSTSAGDFWGGVRESVDPFGKNSSMGISEANMASLKGLAGYGYGAIADLIPNAVTGTIDLARSSQLNPNIADRVANQMKMYEGLKEAPSQMWETTKKAGSKPFEFGEMAGQLTGQPIVTEGLGMIPGSTVARNVRGVTRTATRAAGKPIAAVGRALKSTPPIPGRVPRVMPLRAAQAVARPIGRGLEYVGESMKMTGSPKILQNSEYGPISFTPSQSPISPTADLRGSSAFPETSEMAPELVPNSGAASDAFNPNQPLSSPTGPQKGSVAYPELNEFDPSLVQNSDYGPTEFTPDQPLVSPTGEGRGGMNYPETSEVPPELVQNSDYGPVDFVPDEPLISPTGEGKGGMAYPETNAALPELIPNSQAALDQFGEAVLAPGGEMRGGASYPETSMRPEGVTLNNEYGPVDFDPGDAPTQPIFRPEPPPPPPPPPPNYVENVPWPESSYTEVPWGESPSMELDNPWVDTPTHPGDLQGGQFSREIADSIANEMPENPPTGRGQIMDPNEAAQALTPEVLPSKEQIDAIMSELGHATNPDVTKAETLYSFIRSTGDRGDAIGRLFDHMREVKAKGFKGMSKADINAYDNIVNLLDEEIPGAQSIEEVRRTGPSIESSPQRGQIMPPDEAARTLNPDFDVELIHKSEPRGPEYRKRVLDEAGDGPEGLSVEKKADPVKKGELRTHITVRDAKGKPLASAIIQAGKDGKLAISNISAAETKGLGTAPGKAVKKVIAKAREMDAGRPFSGASPDAIKMIRRLIGDKPKPTTGKMPTNELINYEDQIGRTDQISREERSYVDEIKESIKEKGIVEPIVLRTDKYGKTIIEDGHHRLLAAQELGINDIPVRWGEKGTRSKNIMEKRK